jgi:hypothetical protein
MYTAACIPTMRRGPLDFRTGWKSTSMRPYRTVKEPAARVTAMVEEDVPFVPSTAWIPRWSRWL